MLSLTNYTTELYPLPVTVDEIQKFTIPSEVRTKAQLLLWQKTAKHCYYTCNVGTLHAKRISAENPIQSCMGLIVDYDHPGAFDTITADTWKDAEAPTWVSKSFSGGVHVLYEFESPVTVLNEDVWVRLLKKLSGRLKLRSIFPGLDERAYLNPSLYYEAGSQWFKVGEPLGDGLLFGPLADAYISAKVALQGGQEFPSLPIEAVAKQVEALYPGRWKGDFSLGSRGCRFWDDTADAESCIVKPEGMICFTGDKKFVPWSQILPRAFIESLTSDKIGNAIAKSYFDGYQYWKYDPLRERYLWFNKENLAINFQCDHYLSNSEKGGPSEVKHALNKINTNNRVYASAPFVTRPHGPIWYKGKHYMNTYAEKALAPVEGEASPKDFPWIWNFVSNFFDPHEQLDYFLAWLKTFYMNQLFRREDSKIGHVAFLAGPVSQGKTFFSTTFVSMLVGGCSDASNFLFEKSMFNKELFLSPLWMIDDVRVPNNEKRAAYSNMLKSFAANQAFTYRAKFVDEVTVEWKGRVMVSCNLDPESIQAIPNLDINNDSKLSIFNVSQKTPEQRGFHRNVSELLTAEMPYFARWLLDWKIPEHVIGEPRYGIKNYIHLPVKELAMASSENSQLTEIIQIYLEAYFNALPDAVYWEGTATKLYTLMAECETSRSAIVRLNPDILARKLGKFVVSGSPYVSFRQDKGNRYWKLHRALAENNPDFNKVKEEV